MVMLPAGPGHVNEKTAGCISRATTTNRGMIRARIT